MTHLSINAEFIFNKHLHHQSYYFYKYNILNYYNKSVVQFKT